MNFAKAVGSCAAGGMLLGAVWTVREPLHARGSAQGEQMPIFVFDPTWPRMPRPNNWTLGNVSGVSVDARDHIWILQRPLQGPGTGGHAVAWESL